MVGPSGLEPFNKLISHFIREKHAYALLNFVRTLLSSTGRPKWTRTTDLVLIRHAL